ncbi:MAG: ABC transporter substrate-binding protein [Proteobacteria bacterium]|nr:ABC transporter substrate-binding protein [Pseudomonadota bacterium]
MNYCSKTILLGRASIGLLAAAIIGLSASSASAQETTKMGGIMSMTGGGAAIGTTAEAGWRLAVEEINAAGGILGKKVELVMADTQTDPTHAVSEARRLLENQGIKLLVGPATSQEAVPIIGVAKEKKVAQVSTAASTAITPEVGPYHFSDSVTGLNQMKPNIDYAIDVLKLTKLALISDNGGMSKAAVAEIIDYMKTRGVTPVIVQEFPFKTGDMTPQLFSMRSAGAQAILFINSLGDDTRKLLENRADIGWNVPVLASQTTTNYAVGIAKSLGKEAFNGVMSTQFVGMTYCPGEAVGSSSFAKFAERAKKSVKDLDRMGGAPSLTPYYIQPLILAAAANGAGTLEGPAIADWLEKNAGKVATVIGPLEASKTNHFLPAPAAIKVVKNAFQLREDGLVERADCAK